MSGRRYRGAQVGRLKRTLIIAAYDGRCWICGNKPPVLTLDHVVPRRRGGDCSMGNLRPACPRCNEARDRRLKAMPARTQRKAIADELTDRWWQRYPLPEVNKDGTVTWLDPALAESLPSYLRRLCPRAEVEQLEAVAA